MDNYKKIFLIQKWAESNPKFDTSFINSLRNYLDEGNQLTDSQEFAIERIVTGFRMDLDEVEKEICQTKVINLYNPKKIKLQQNIDEETEKAFADFKPS